MTDVTLGIGGSKYLFSSKVLDVIEYLEMGNFTRWDADATIFLSHDFSKHPGFYFAPKYVWSTTSFDETLVRVSEAANQVVEARCNSSNSVCPDVSLPDKVIMRFVGATAGLRKGIPSISVYLELTAGNTFATARVLGVTRQLGGLTLYRAGGLGGTFWGFRGTALLVLEGVSAVGRLLPVDDDDDECRLLVGSQALVLRPRHASNHGRATRSSSRINDAAGEIRCAGHQPRPFSLGAKLHLDKMVPHRGRRLSGEAGDDISSRTLLSDDERRGALPCKLLFLPQEEAPEVLLTRSSNA